MRINILEAGLATYLMAGKGLLPKNDDEPKRGAEITAWNSTLLPLVPKRAPKDEAH